MPLTPTHPETQPNPQTLFKQLANALNSTDDNIRTLINHLPSTWQATNHKGIPLNKTMLQRSSCGELREADGLQALQQTILTAHPPPNHTVTQYTTYFTTSMSMGSSIWRHAIQNACNDDHLPHPYTTTPPYSISTTTSTTLLS